MARSVSIKDFSQEMMLTAAAATDKKAADARLDGAGPTTDEAH